MTEPSHISKSGCRAWVELGVAGLALVLALVTAFQSYGNRALQKQLAGQQAELNRAQTLANLDNSLIQLMAKAAVDRNDSAMRDLLARNGVTMNAKAAASQADSVAQDTK